MATGFPTAYAVEIEFTTGVWTAVTADVDHVYGLRIHYGRANEFEDVQPGTLELRLRDETGAYTPDNPTSANWPNVVERKRIRVIITKGSARTRFFGNITSWSPYIVDPDEAYCDVSAVTLDGVLRRRFDSDYTESNRYDMRTGTTDIYAMRSGNEKATRVDNIGTGAGTARLIKPVTSTAKRGTGTLTDADSIMLEGMWSAEPSTARIAPIWRFDTDPTIRTNEVEGIYFWTRTKSIVGSDGPYTALIGYDKAGLQLWAFKYVLVGGGTDLQVFNAADSALLTLAGGVDDGRWVHAWMDNTGSGNTNVAYLAEDASGAYVAGALALDIRQTAVIIVGGKDTALTAGKQSKCPEFNFAGLVVTDLADIFGLGNRAGPGYGGNWGVGTRALQFANWAGTNLFGAGVDNVAVLGVTHEGETLWEAQQKAARTVGAVIWVDPGGQNTIRYPDAVRTNTPVMTLVIGSDDEQDASGMTFSRDVDSIPTRVRVESPDGEVVVADAAREAAGVQAEVSLTTVARNLDAARYPGQFLLAQSGSLRISQVGMSLVSSTTDRYAEHAALYPGARIRLTNLPSAFLGYTQTDLIVQGWTEKYALDDVTVVLDTTPADSPASGELDSSDRGRVGATGATLNGTIDSSATTVAVTLAGELWTTVGGDFPMKIKIDGEVITLNNAPASASAPSFTGCTRGVDGTTALGHTTGAAVQVQIPLTVAMG